VGLVVGSLAAGCLPFFHAKPEPPRPPAMVRRLVEQTNALGVPPSAPRLPALTHTLARAVEALPKTPAVHDSAQQIESEAGAMEHGGEGNEREPARRGLTAALLAVERMKNPAGGKGERERAMARAHRALEQLATAPPPATDAIEEAYRAVAATLLVATGGHVVAGGSDLSALIARFAVADAEEALRSAPQVVYAMAGKLDAIPDHPGKVTRSAAELRKRAERLADAATLEQAAQLKEALRIALNALDAVEHAKREADLQRLRKEAHAAFERISAERPLELQRAAVQDAFRTVADLLAVAGSGEARPSLRR
jgi:hypothetical protein